jgi:hypothetical protein
MVVTQENYHIFFMDIGLLLCELLLQVYDCRTLFVKYMQYVKW